MNCAKQRVLVWFGLPGLAQVQVGGLVPKVAEAQIAERGQKMRQKKRKRETEGDRHTHRGLIIPKILFNFHLISH